MNIRTKFPAFSLIFAALAIFTTQVSAQSLKSAEAFSVLGATTVTNTGLSIVTGNVGVSPGFAITGFPPGVVLNGAIHTNDATAIQAHADLAAAYTAFAGLASPNNLSGTDLGGLTLSPGVYHFDTSATSSGILILDGQNNPNARFVIQIGTTFTANIGSSVLLINGANGRNVYFQVGTSATLAAGSTFTGNLLANGSITAMSAASATARLLSVTGAVNLNTNSVVNLDLSPTQLRNISTRGNVLTGDNVLIGGFIITGSAPKRVLIRGIGPSLTNVGIVNAMADPTLELHAANGSLITSDDNWKDSQQTEIQNSGLPPNNDLEPAIVATLAPGNYTAVVAGKNGTTGIALVEVYDLDPTSNSDLGNISSRGFVQTGDDVMIAGFILGNGTLGAEVIVRAVGPSLTAFGIANPLADPTLELRDVNGTLLASNDNWKDDPVQQIAITASGFAPSNDAESALVAILLPGNYTAIVAGKNGTTGIAVAEVYHLH